MDRLNISAREVLKENDLLKDGKIFETKNGKLEVCEGEKLIFTDSSKKNGIYRSEIVTVSSVSDKNITVLKSDSRTVQFDPQKFDSFKYGYAVTAHKSQGSSADRSFVLVDGHGMDREKFYVALSRGRENNEIYADKDTVGSLYDYQNEQLSGLSKEAYKAKENELYLSELNKIINKSHRKITTQDFVIKDEATMAKISSILEKKVDTVTNAFDQLQKDFKESMDKIANIKVEKTDTKSFNLSKEKQTQKQEEKTKNQEKVASQDRFKNKVRDRAIERDLF